MTCVLIGFFFFFFLDDIETLLDGNVDQCYTGKLKRVEL